MTERQSGTDVRRQVPLTLCQEGAFPVRLRRASVPARCTAAQAAGRRRGRLGRRPHQRRIGLGWQRTRKRRGRRRCAARARRLAFAKRGGGGEACWARRALT
eukprot:6200003-Pleurochrysis_carterae.AAC.3